ncbi:hypothetical protein LZ32DRAFT_147425 [Colletotrichum eremochloae]|nr:hypothetical protein LZ32DRAFT_147425 [Colletotrichum eremochloae]
MRFHYLGNQESSWPPCGSSCRCRCRKDSLTHTLIFFLECGRLKMSPFVQCPMVATSKRLGFPNEVTSSLPGAPHHPAPRSYTHTHTHCTAHPLDGTSSWSSHCSVLQARLT